MGRYRGVTAYTGLPGSGKTSSMVDAGLRAIKQGRPVYVNAGFDFRPALEAGTVFRSFEEFGQIPNGSTVLWDELPVYVSARRWQDFPDGMLYRLTQIRKSGLHLHYSAIDEAMVDANVRRLTMTWVRCRAMPGGRLIRRQWWWPSELKRDKPYRRDWLMISRRLIDAYDTLAIVDSPPPKYTERERALWAAPSTGAIAPAAAAVSPGLGVPTNQDSQVTSNSDGPNLVGLGPSIERFRRSRDTHATG